MAVRRGRSGPGPSNEPPESRYWASYYHRNVINITTDLYLSVMIYVHLSQGVQCALGLAVAGVAAAVTPLSGRQRGHASGLA